MHWYLYYSLSRDQKHREYVNCFLLLQLIKLDFRLGIS